MTRSRQRERVPTVRRRGRGEVKSSGNTFLIVTEGEKTEPNYLRALRDRLRLRAAYVEIVHPEGTDPLTLTERAIELRDQRSREVKRRQEVAYDEVWVVFDLEQLHGPRRQQAIQAVALADREGIRIAHSDPCFEYWLLLHEEYTTAPFADCEEVTRRFKNHWSDYEKGWDPPSELIEKLPDAVSRAGQCRQYHQASGGQGTPSTEVDLLACNLNSATRKSLQFKLNS